MELPDPQAPHRAQIVACLGDGKRLFLIYDQLLDGDLQPAGEDFSIKIRGKSAAVKSVQLQAPIQSGSSWSLITLTADRLLTADTEVTVSYHPLQWFMFALTSGESVAPFELSVRLGDGSTLASIAAPDAAAGGDGEASRLISGAKARVVKARGRHISIALERELDIYQPLEAESFRAELNDQWLTVAAVQFDTAAAPEAAAQLRVELRETLPAGSQVKVAFKSGKKPLKTRDDAAVVSFAASGITSSDSRAAAPQPAAASGQQRPRAIGCNYAALSDTDKQLAQLLGLAEPQTPPAPEPVSPIRPAGDSGRAAATQDKPAPIPIAPKPVAADPPPVATPQPASRQLPQPEAAPAVTADPPPAEVERPAGAAARGVKKRWWLGGAAACVAVAVAYIGSQSTGGGAAPVTGAGARESCALNYPDGGYYRGQCTNGRRDGEGDFRWASGVRYRGGWANDRMQGEGVMTLTNGARIEGRWQRGKSVGSATINWPNGSHYVGEIRNTKPHGIGRITYTSGDIYKGAFAEGLMQGHGIMIWASGAKYEGSYDAGKASGDGIYWSTDGKRFEGVFADGKPTDRGTCYRPDGSSSAGRCRG